ncbi:MAG: SDR family NAD(P)-dependent oxidoreductase, partial [Deltaproteobacteria bacterium]|nr:SDR family NAD(P)-dependent oxidoreductase [Deltaproteobacteria bacterium]
MAHHGRLEGKVAVITGAASGIGRATALLFAREGAKLVLADVADRELKETLRLVKKANGNAVIKKTDVAVEKEVQDLIHLALKTYSQVDILCNNAGITGDLKDVEDQEADDWQKVLDVNVMGPVFATKHVAKHMKERRSGAIVNT